MLAMPSRSSQEWSMNAKNQWLDKCVTSRARTSRQERIVIQRFGISVEIPNGMQYEPNESGEEVILASISAIAVKSCLKEAKVLHGQFIGGSGYSYIGITDEIIRDHQKYHCGARMVILLGKNHILHECRGKYINAKNPLSGKRFTLHFHRINNEQTLMQFIRSARLLR